MSQISTVHMSHMPTVNMSQISTVNMSQTSTGQMSQNRPKSFEDFFDFLRTAPCESLLFRPLFGNCPPELLSKHSIPSERSLKKSKKHQLIFKHSARTPSRKQPSGQGFETYLKITGLS